MRNSVVENLIDFGATESDLLMFSANDPRMINYDSIVRDDMQTIFPDGVIEVVGRPILYFVERSKFDPTISVDDQIRNLVEVLACRGERASLLIVEHGVLELFPIHPDTHNSRSFCINDRSANAKGFIRDFLEGSYPTELRKILSVMGNKTAVEDILFDLLRGVGKKLNEISVLRGDHEAILGLIGRALLTRFLIDRKILTSTTFPDLFEHFEPENFFSTSASAVMTNQWLDDTFNGDLLRLPVKKQDYLAWFESLDASAFSLLSLILGHANVHGQLSLPGFVNFAYVPVGLLSEVYERYAHENLDDNVKKSARKESIHYTPRNIAEYMLNEAFDSVSTCEPHAARILDPSCGAGVFIVLAFRRLIAEYWKKTGSRPDTFEIREILYEQVNGFDINSSALTLAALGLYLSALELDSEPLPTTKLKFEHNLIGRVLYDVREPGFDWERSKSVMGSLGGAVSKEHDGRYDIVLGNPPWSPFDSSLKKDLTRCVIDVAEKNCPDTLKKQIERYENPDQVPDIPFFWKCTQWAKSGATIALAMHARILFKNSRLGAASRDLLFNSVNITGILNGSALRQTSVWPRISAQFCLIFACNEPPMEADYFDLITPVVEKNLNETRQQIRIDYSAAHPIQSSVLWENPHILKTLSVGNALDALIIDKLLTGNMVTIGDYWDQTFGTKVRSSTGYQVVNKDLDSQFLIDSNCLNLGMEDKLTQGYEIDPRRLRRFDKKWLHRPRTLKIYESPLVVVNKAIGAKPETISARISFSSLPIAFSESFYGYSCADSKYPDILAKYLFALLNSDLLLYYLILTSSQYAVEREVCHKADIDSFPMLNFDGLSAKQRTAISSAYDSFLETGKISVLNSVVFRLYGLTKADREVIKDTLAVASPIAGSKALAQRAVSQVEKNAFFRKIRMVIGLPDLIINECSSPLSSWNFFTISSRLYDINSVDISIFESITENTGTSKIIVHGEGYLTIGFLNQYRYWTKSRAKLLALTLLDDYSDILG